MMICPETFYEMNLKDKTESEILAVIRQLKWKIGRLKNIVEHPNYECTMHPSEHIQISCSQLYLERAKQALVEAGGEYIPSASEQKAIDFDNNIPYISKVQFYIGGYFGYKTRTYTIDGDKIHSHIESLPLPPSYIEDSKIEPLEKSEFLEQIKGLHIGEWRRKYEAGRFGLVILDGTHWHLKIHFSNGHRPIKIDGRNAYPYNFDRLLDFFEIEE